VFLAALTTFAGFFSLCFTSVHPIREFGYFSSFGVIAAFIVAVTLIPSLLILREPKKKRDSGKEDTYSTVIADTLMVVARKKRTVLLFAAVVVVFSIYGLTKIISDNAMIEYFKPDTEVAKSDRFIRENFGGSKVVNVVLHGDSAEIILHPDNLAAFDGLGEYLSKNPNVGKLMGFTDMVKRINQVLNASADAAGLERVEQAEDVFDDFGFGFWGSDVLYDNMDYVPISDSEPPPQPEEKFLTQKEFFAILDRASSASRTLSANDLARELKKQVNYEGSAYYEIPADPARYGKDSPEDLQRLVSNYLVLLSGGISSYANDDLEPTAIKTTVQLKTLGMEDSQEIIDAIDRYLAVNVPPGVDVTIGGATIVEGSLNSLIVQSQITSVLISILCVFIIMAASNRSLIAGIIGIAPLSISILINFAVMGLAGIKLNLGTSMVASVSVGIGIDYSIHFIEAFKREYRQYKGDGNFLWHSFNSSGKAIIINAVSVGAGFAVLLLSRFNMLCGLGLLIAITMFTSALVSITVLPVLLVLIKPKFVTEGVSK
jgi:predicted RND superfamily exporter protein